MRARTIYSPGSENIAKTLAVPPPAERVNVDEATGIVGGYRVAWVVRVGVLMKGESVCSMKVTSPEKQGQTTVLLRSLSPGKPNRLNVVCPRFRAAADRLV